MKFPFVLFVLLIAAFIGGGLFWYSAIFKEQKPELTASDTTASKMCSGFAQAPGEISCQEAIRIAQAKYGGTTQAILQGSGFPKKDNGSSSAMRSFWRIEILLENPITKDQETFNGARSYIDRETGEELAGGYTKKQ